MADRPIPVPFTAPVRGISVYQDVARTLTEGDPLTVSRQPDNPHDSNAVVLRTLDGRTIGYLPAELARRLSVRPEPCWHGQITELLRGETWGARVSVTNLAPDAGPQVHIAAPPAPADPVPAPLPEQAPTRVTALSGRHLGTLVCVQDAVVVVRGDDGTLKRYPRVVVSLSEPAEPATV